MTTGTQTRTFTATDIHRVFANFAADYGMLAQATGLQSREDVATTVSDLIGFAKAEYLLVVDIILWDASGTKLRAAKYSITTTAAGWASQQPANNLWPRTIGGRLQVVATLSSAWWALDELTRAQERKRWGIMGVWTTTHTDTSHHELVSQLDRRYSSNGYGMEKTLYR